MCADGYGPNSADNGCSLCTSAPVGLKRCKSDLTTADACDSGYGLISNVCTECAVSNCNNCSVATSCDTCKDGYGLVEKQDECLACA